MAIRIYALAKELKLDTKVIAELCVKVGLPKPSPLASLSDEDVAKLKDFLSGKRPARPAAPAAPTAPIPVLPSAPHPPAAPRPAAPAAPVSVEEPPEEELEESAPIAAPLEPVEDVPSAPPVTVAESAATTATAVAPPPTAPTTPAFRREDYIGPGGASGGKIPVLRDRPTSRRRSGGDAEGGEPTRDRERTGPAIKLAPMPAAPQPVAPPKPSEPAPQKPDIRLPLDAIRAASKGGMAAIEKPLSDHMRKTEQKRKTTGPKKPGEAQPGPLPPPSSLPGRGDKSRRKTAVAGAEGEEPASPGTLGGREQRQLKRRRSTKPAAAGRRDDDDSPIGLGRRPTHIRRTGGKTAAPRKSQVVIQLPCTVRAFSEALGVPSREVLAKLLKLGATTLSINAEIGPDIAELLAIELGVEVDLRRHVDLETKVLSSLEEQDDEAALAPRPPIVTFLGHVDHGKTSLLDRILGLDVVSTEKGGITQHIRAYRIEKNDRSIAFVDTPGHEAFTEMRARGANVTDIAVLVVAADDGVMPQTEEAISHARAAGVPIVVALNKIDLPGINTDRIFQQLAANELLPSQWGGDIEVVPTSATTGKGIDELLETILTVAELNEYRANPDRPASGTCLEAEMHEDRGVVAKLIVQKGTLRTGDIVVCGGAYGRVKALYNTLKAQETFDEAGPSTPVNITGLNVAPNAGDRFHVLGDISQARQLADERLAQSRRTELSGAGPHVTLENLFERLGQEKKVQTLNIILRADVRGSIEAIRKELSKLDHPEVQVKILQAAVGGISEADVHLADASDAVIIGFSVVPDEAARSLADNRGVQIRRYDIIYQVTDDLRAALEGMLKPEKRVQELGRALVQRTFHISRIGTVAGCRVLAGTITRDARVRVIRESRVIGEYPLESLRREKDDAREVREGMECGMKLAGFNDLKEGDVLEAYKIEEVKRTF